MFMAFGAYIPFHHNIRRRDCPGYGHISIYNHRHRDKQYRTILFQIEL
jgi:hypothetical protein